MPCKYDLKWKGIIAKMITLACRKTFLWCVLSVTSYDVICLCPYSTWHTKPQINRDTCRIDSNGTIIIPIHYYESAAVGIHLCVRLCSVLLLACWNMACFTVDRLWGVPSTAVSWIWPKGKEAPSAPCVPQHRPQHTARASYQCAYLKHE